MCTPHPRYVSHASSSPWSPCASRARSRTEKSPSLLSAKTRKAFACSGVTPSGLNHSTGDSYTRCPRPTAVTCVCVLPVYQCCVGRFRAPIVPSNVTICKYHVSREAMSSSIPHVGLRSVQASMHMMPWPCLQRAETVFCICFLHTRQSVRPIGKPRNQCYLLPLHYLL